MLQVFYIGAIIASVTGGFLGYFSSHTPETPKPTTVHIASYNVIDNFEVIGTESPNSIQHQADQCVMCCNWN